MSLKPHRTTVLCGFRAPAPVANRFNSYRVGQMHERRVNGDFEMKTQDEMKGGEERAGTRVEADQAVS